MSRIGKILEKRINEGLEIDSYLLSGGPTRSGYSGQKKKVIDKMVAMFKQAGIIATIGMSAKSDYYIIYDLKDKDFSKSEDILMDLDIKYEWEDDNNIAFNL
jgi:hypothetical protein